MEDNSFKQYTFQEWMIINYPNEDICCTCFNGTLNTHICDCEYCEVQADCDDCDGVWSSIDKDRVEQLHLEYLIKLKQEKVNWDKQNESIANNS